jgi:hypothetical protein
VLVDDFDWSPEGGSMMEVKHVGAVRGFEQAVRCDHTAEGLGMG